MKESEYNLRLILFVLAGLGVVTYLPALFLPLLSDDYNQILIGRRYGPVSRWADLARDPMYCCRATSVVMTYWTEQLFGISAAVLNASGLVLHILNTYLVFALGLWRVIGWRVSAVAAAFFAVYEGHQEAVMWYAALPELLVLFFSLLCLLMWVKWIESGRELARYYCAAVGFFVLALLSKESAVVVGPLLLLISRAERVPWRTAIVDCLPYAGLVLVYTGFIFAAQGSHPHFLDGTFSLRAPVWINLFNSTARLFWFWGALSLLALLITGADKSATLLMVAGLWIVITLLPYSFLSYMPYVPSRHVYFASVGLSWIVGAGFLALKDRWRDSRRWAPAVLAAVVLLSNCLYIWTKKHRQFVRRAAPNVALIDFARKAPGPIRVKCFPFGPAAATAALAVTLPDQAANMTWDPVAPREDPDVFCDDSQP